MTTTREPISRTDRELTAYATELRNYLDTIDAAALRRRDPEQDATHSRTATHQSVRESAPIMARDPAIEPAASTRPVQGHTPSVRGDDQAAATRELTGLRALTGAKLVDARRHIETKRQHLEQLRSLTAATRAAAAAAARAENVRREHTRITQPAQALTAARTDIDSHIAAVRSVDSAIDAARTELAGIGRLARAKRAELEAKIIALAAERATAVEQVKAARTVAETIAPANQWDKIAADAAEAERCLPAALRDAEEGDREALNTADKTLERIDTQQGQLTRQDAAITTEQERRRDLTPERKVAEATQREQWSSEKDTVQPEAKERNNRAMMLARQREQADQQKQHGRGIER